MEVTEITHYGHTSSSFVEGDEQQDHPNCQTSLENGCAGFVSVLHTK